LLSILLLVYDEIDLAKMRNLPFPILLFQEYDHSWGSLDYEAFLLQFSFSLFVLLTLFILEQGVHPALASIMSSKAGSCVRENRIAVWWCIILIKNENNISREQSK